MDSNNVIFFFYNFIFFVAVLGAINNRNDLMLVLICIEVCYLMIIALFLCTSFLHFKNASFQGYCVFFLAVAASESAVGLSILITSYKSALKTKIINIQILHG